jgi:hypothetical protein
MRHVLRRLALAAVATTLSATAILIQAPPAPAASCGLVGLVGSCISVDFPVATSYAFATRNAGTTSTSTEQVFTISANTTWGIHVYTDLANGRMKEWNGTAYVASSPKIMLNPLQWRLSSKGGAAQATSFADLSTTPSTVVTAQPDTGCLLSLCGTTTLGVTYQSRPSFSDPARTYRVLVTFDAANGY